MNEAQRNAINGILPKFVKELDLWEFHLIEELQRKVNKYNEPILGQGHVNKIKVCLIEFKEKNCG